MTKIYIKLMLTMLFWGGTFVSGRLLSMHVSPFTSAFLRFALAAAILLAAVYRQNGRLPHVPRAQRLPVLGLGLTGVFAYNLLFFWGLQSVDAGRAAVIVANNPIFIAVFAALIFRERLDGAKSAGVLISVSGAIIVISKGDLSGLVSGELGWGELIIFGCVISWVLFSLIGKSVVAALSPLAAISYAAAAGAVFLFFPAAASGMFGVLGQLSYLDWLNIAYLGVCGTALAFVWYYEGIKCIGATRAGLFISFVPINAIIIAWFILDEPVTASLAGGTSLILAGVYLTNNGLPDFHRLRNMVRRIRL
jgi:drug/metabolite transporter (DMT)-like permease